MRKYSTPERLRTKARAALKNRWFVAVLAALIFVLCSVTYSFDTGVTSEEVYGYEESLMAYEYNVDQYVAAGDFEGLTDYILNDTFALTFALSAVVGSAVLFLLNVFVFSPIMVGYYHFNHELFRSKKTTSLKPVFSMFGHGYWKTIGLRIRCYIRYLLPELAGILLWILAIFVGAFLATLTLIDFLFDFFILVGFILFVLCCAKSVYKWLGLLMARHLLADHPDWCVREIMDRSEMLMKGHKLRLIWLFFSFTGWVVVSVLFTCGLGLAAVVPYYFAAETAFYRELARGGKGLHLPAVFTKQ